MACAFPLCRLDRRADDRDDASRESDSGVMLKMLLQFMKPPEQKIPISFAEALIIAVVGGFLSGASWSVGRSLVEHQEMVLFAGRWIYIGPTSVKAAVFVLLVFVSFTAIAAWVRMMKKRRATIMASNES
jgi:hypothetical protein